VPVLQSLKVRFPKQFNSVVDDYYESILKGRTEAETTDSCARSCFRLFQDFFRSPTTMCSSTSTGDDEDTLPSTTEIPRMLGVCFRERGGTGLSLRLPAVLVERERKVHDRVIRTAAVRPEVDQTVMKALWTKVRKELAAKGVRDSDIGLIRSDHVDKSKHSLYCATPLRIFARSQASSSGSSDPDARGVGCQVIRGCTGVIRRRHLRSRLALPSAANR